MIIKDWKRVFSSMCYFLKLIFIAKDYDVVFVSSETFNRGSNGENVNFKPMIEFCKKNNLKYIIFEDTYFKSYTDYTKNEESISLDFILIAQIILKKIHNLIYKKPTNIDEVYSQELKVSKILKILFFKKFNSAVYITLIWNNVTLWRCINPSACIVDYQHGVINNGHEGYIKYNEPPKVKLKNNITTLVYGDWFKRTLIENDKSNFYNEKNVITVGASKILNEKNKILTNNKRIIFTLQLTPDFQKKENEHYVKILDKLIDANAHFLSENNYKIIFKHHPRYSTHHCPDINMKYDFINFDNKTPTSDLLKSASLHMTFHSTSAFDAATIHIPTIFIDMFEPFSPNDMYLNQYKYPCRDLIIKDYKDFKNILVNIDNKEIYNHCCDDVYQWSKEFYHDFNEFIFGDFLSRKISESKNVRSNLTKNDT
ncbi:hypothetical protein N9S10_03905 [Gammaproteobacteria bacterium]|nr:hypothetical protein [Gammaproteobacteria bacterium]